MKDLKVYAIAPSPNGGALVMKTVTTLAEYLKTSEVKFEESAEPIKVDGVLIKAADYGAAGETVQ